LYFGNTAFSSVRTGALFNLSAGTIVTTSAGATSSMTDEGDGWWRCSVTVTSDSDGGIYGFSFSPAPDSVSTLAPAYTPASTGLGIYAFGAQVNEGGIKPYVKTTSATVSAEVLTLSEPFTWDTTGTLTHYLGLRAKDGSVNGPYACTWADTDKVAITNLDVTPYTGSAYERTHATFGWSETWRQEARVIAVRPRGMYQVEVEAINEDPSVHTAETGITAPPVNSSQLPTLYTAPVVRGLTIVSLPTDSSLMLMSWESAPGADYYIIEQSMDGTDWTRIAETRASNFICTAQYLGATIIRIAAVGMTRGPWVTAYYSDSGDYMWTTDSALMWDADDTLDMWRY
jgi:hypothetical protein